MTPVLEVDRLSLALGEVTVLREVSLSPQRARSHWCGESGAGKSMLARTVLGLLPGSARLLGGAIRFGRDLSRLAANERRALMGREIALVPQDPLGALNPARTIGRQLSRFLRLRGGLGRKDATVRAIELRTVSIFASPPGWLPSTLTSCPAACGSGC